MSLESIRKLRMRVEEAVTMELAQITQDLVRMERRCDMLDVAIQAESETHRMQAEQGMAIEQVLEWQGRLEARHAELKEARCAVTTLTDAWNQTQIRLVEASQERKIIDRLVTRRRQEGERELRHREQHATDEVAGRRHYSSGDRLS